MLCKISCRSALRFMSITIASFGTKIARACDKGISKIQDFFSTNYSNVITKLYLWQFFFHEVFRYYNFKFETKLIFIKIFYFSRRLLKRNQFTNFSTKLFFLLLYHTMKNNNNVKCIILKAFHKFPKIHALTIFPLYTHEHKRLLLSTPVASPLATSREFPKWLTKPIASISTKAKMAIYRVSLSRVPVPLDYNFFHSRFA